jgi:hypothetical protein
MHQNQKEKKDQGVKSTYCLKKNSSGRLFKIKTQVFRKNSI